MLSGDYLSPPGKSKKRSSSGKVKSEMWAWVWCEGLSLERFGLGGFQTSSRILWFEVNLRFWQEELMFGVLLSFFRFLIVLACLILSVLSTIDQYQTLAHTTLFWVVSLQPSERCRTISKHTKSDNMVQCSVKKKILLLMQINKLQALQVVNWHFN